MPIFIVLVEWFFLSVHRLKRPENSLSFQLKISQVNLLQPDRASYLPATLFLWTKGVYLDSTFPHKVWS